VSGAQEQPLAAAGADVTGEMRRQFTTLLAHSPDAIVILDARGRVREWNPAAETLFGWPRVEILDAGARRLVPPENLAHFEGVWAVLHAGGAVPPFRTIRLHRDGTRTPVRIHVAPIQEDGRFTGAVASLRDLSAGGESARAAATGAPDGAERPPEGGRFGRSEMTSQLALGARVRDELTGLPGRRALQRRLAEPVAAGLGRGVAVLDVDAFALINQTYGPDAGDDVLRELARRLGEVAGPAVVGRWQADEFVCVVDAEDPAVDLNEFSMMVVRATRAPFLVRDDRLRLTVSAGLVTGALAPVNELLGSAMIALRAAKDTGRDRAVWFDPAMQPASGGDFRLANDLRHGIEHGELRLHFQPIMELTTNDVTGVEALVRWERPGVGLLGPVSFIDVAERTGQIVPLGAWVAHHACRAAVELAQPGGGPRSVSINVSARQLSDPGLVAMLRGALQDTGCPPSNLIIEVTETALMHDMDAATATLEAIKELGVGLDLDDFGTGYSSLLYLKHFPVDRIKIDQSFVTGLGTDGADTAIVASTIALAHSVGKQAVAEGVETVDQLALLRQMGCDFVQGYLLSRPLALDQLHHWLSQHVPAQRQARDDQAAGGGSGPSTAKQRNRLADQRDQVADHRDQAADERDQVADHRDQAADERDQAGDQRDQTGNQAADRRDQAADERDQAADRRDQAGDERDQAGDERDQAGDERDQAGEQPETRLGAEALHRSAQARREAASDRTRASQDRGAGASERVQAELDRDTALADRGAGASERVQAELDRDTALADRGAGASERVQAELGRDTALADRRASTREREYASVDALTGAYLRVAGLMELEDEIARARQTGQPLVVAFLDVDGLDAINETSGHAGGDSMLVEVANALRTTLRTHDMIIRAGVGEFVCALTGQNVAEVAERLARVNAALAVLPQHGSVTVGLAELQEDDSSEQLVARAGATLHRERDQQR
jgi:diguanylate cyclase (GGDEF)-like protein/PAS domain S-box-containing protein